MDKVKIYCQYIEKPKKYGKQRDNCSAGGIKEIIDVGCKYILKNKTHYVEYYPVPNMLWKSNMCTCDGFKTHSSARYNSNDIYPFNLYPDYEDDDIETGIPAVAPCFFTDKCYGCIGETYGKILWHIDDIFKHTCGHESFFSRIKGVEDFIGCGCNGKWKKI